MTVGIGAGGNVGIALETTAGTYVAPTKFFPIMSENLQFNAENATRRVIRGVADPLGKVQGNSHIAGDIKMEVLSDAFPWFLRASRNTVVKTGTGPYTYTYTPSAAAVAPDKTLSITVVRAGVPQGFVGCIVSGFDVTVEEGIAVVTFHIVGTDEAAQANPTPTFTNQTPYGEGQYSIQIPTASVVNDVNTFTFSVNDNAEPQFRRRAVRSAAFIKFGEREVTLEVERDFDGRTELDAFKALTAQSITVRLDKGASDRVDFKMANSVKETYEISGLAGQGDLITATISHMGHYDTGTSKAYEVIVVTPTENIP
jgi:hypothetical protein